MNPPDLTPAFDRELEQIEEACNKLGFWAPATIYIPPTKPSEARRAFMWRKFGETDVRYLRNGISYDQIKRWRFCFKMTPKGETTVEAFNSAPVEFITNAPVSVRIAFASHLPELLKKMKVERVALNTRFSGAVDTLYEIRCELDKEAADVQ